MESLTHAYLLAALATLCWGFIVIPLKLSRLPGRLGIGISMLTGSIVMFALAGGEMLAAFQLSGAVLARFLVAGSFQFALGAMLYYESIQRGSISVAVPVTRAKVIPILFLSVWLGLEVFKWSLFFACLLVVLGGVLISRRTGGDPPDRPGENHRHSVLLAAAVCVCWAIGETLIGTLPRDMSPIAANGLLLWSGLAVYALYAAGSGAWRGFRGVKLRDALCYVAHGLISFSLAYVFFVRAIQIAGPPRIVCITSTYPLISALVGWVAFKERCNWPIAAGAALLVGGVVLLQFA